MKEVYEPREDSELLKKYVGKYAKGNVLDMGTGSGFLALEASRKAKKVLAVDISSSAVRYCRNHIKKRNITFLVSDLFSKISQTNKFNLIIFNPPYLPLDKREPEDSRLMTTGGKKGYEIIDRFLQKCHDYLEPKGKILILFSSLTNKAKVSEIIEKHGFKSKQIAKKKIPFEELYVHLVERKDFLEKLVKIRSISMLAKGKRGVVYTGIHNGKKVAIKIAKETAPPDRIKNEAHYLKIFNKKKIGPKLIAATPCYVIMQFVEGKDILKYVQSATTPQIKRVIKDVLEMCYTMDQMNVNKEEMHHPVKHIIIDKKPVLIDFERCRKTPKPKNVTQFCQFLTSATFLYGLENKGIKITKKIAKFAAKYKKEQSRRTFDLLEKNILGN